MSANSKGLFKDRQTLFDQYDQDGYVIIPDVFSSKECLDIIQASNDFDGAQSGEYLPEFQPHLNYPIIEKTINHPILVPFMEKILGGKISVIQTQFFHGRPGTKGFKKHQDNSYVQALPDCFGSAWIPLVDVSQKNGTLRVFSRTHTLPILPIQEVPDPDAFGQDFNGVSHELIMPESGDYPPVEVAVKGGSAVILHGHTVHDSFDNLSDDFRKVLLITFLRRGTPFRPGNQAKRKEFEVG